MKCDILGVGKQTYTMTEEQAKQVQETLEQFEQELTRLERERAQIIAEYTKFLEAKRIEVVMKDIAAR